MLKQKLIREETLVEKNGLVVRARTIVLYDDFGYDRQRYSEVYFVNIMGTQDSIGLTFDELRIVQQLFAQYKLKHNED